MIRLVCLGALSLLLIFVLYLPAAHPPERFIAQIRREHDLQTAFWGLERASRFLQETIEMSQTMVDLIPPTLWNDPQGGQASRAVSQEMAHVKERFFGNAYFRSIDALVLLATYRVAAVRTWLEVETPFAAVLLLDGLLVRTVRAKELKPHDPERVAVHACLCVLLLCATVVAFVVPIAITPVSMGLLLPIGSLFMSRIIANYHRAA